MTTHDPTVVVARRLSEWRAWLVLMEPFTETALGLPTPVAALYSAINDAVKEATPDPIPPEPTTGKVLIMNTDSSTVIWHRGERGWYHSGGDEDSFLSWRQLWESTAWERVSIHALSPALEEGDAQE